jgi:hypothetical protein
MHIEAKESSYLFSQRETLPEEHGYLDFGVLSGKCVGVGIGEEG